MSVAINANYEVARKRLQFFLGKLSCPLSSGGQIGVAMVSTIVFALLAHLYCWTNSMFSHDSLMIVQGDWAHQIAIGRPFQQFYVAIRGDVVAPWLIGALGTMYMSVANCILVNVLEIKMRMSVILVCAVMASNATITLCNATYLDWYDICMLAYLFSCSAVWFCLRRGIWVNVLLGSIFLTLSLGLYQSYISVFVTIVLLACIRLLTLCGIKDALVVGAKGFAAITFGAVLYGIALGAVRALYGVGSSSAYNSVSSAFAFGDTSVVQVLGGVLIDPIIYLLFPETHAVRVCAAGNLLLLVLFGLTLVMLTMRARLSISRVFSLVLAVVLIPLGMGCVNFAAYGKVHSLMLLSYYLFYPALFMVLEMFLFPSDNQPLTSKKREIVSAGALLAVVVSAGLVFSNVVYANQVYLKKNLEYQSTTAVLTRLEGELESLEDYVPGVTPVLFVGVLADNPYFSDMRSSFPPDATQDSFDENGQFTKYAVGLGADISIYGPGQMKQFYTYVLGCPINIVSSDEVSSGALATAEKSPVYPLDGCLTMADGTVIVHLS